MHTGYGPIQFVIGDLDNNSVEDMIDDDGQPTLYSVTGTSSDTSIVQDPGPIQTFDDHKRTYSFSAAPGNFAGHAVVTVTAIDKDMNPSDICFDVNVIDDQNGSVNTPPKFNDRTATFLDDTVGDGTAAYPYTVSDSDTLVSQLLITAVSSNVDIVPNDSQHLTVVPGLIVGTGQVQITPLPLGNPNVPQAVTITLSVQDENYTRHQQFLYVRRDVNSPATAFLRASGIYNLDPAADQHHDDDFVTGEMIRVSWREIDKGNNVFDWTTLNDAISAVVTNDISLNLIEEPCYVGDWVAANEPSPNLWCDSNAAQTDWLCDSVLDCTSNGKDVTKRVCPWDSYLQQRRDAFLQKLAEHLNLGGMMDRIKVINPNLPGGDTGIRDGSMALQDMPNYSRENLLQAVQHELRSVQDHFPGKLVQFGFFNVGDADHCATDCTRKLYQWLYRDAGDTLDANGIPLVPLWDEFNGIRRPRVSFFQEDLAATRLSADPGFFPYTNPASTTAYTYSPVICELPWFEYYCELGGNVCSAGTCQPNIASYNNATVFQANTIWSGPLKDGQKVDNIINATPNDGLEAAFNAYLNQYLEVYPDDLAHAVTTDPDAPWDAERWYEGLKSWHDYFAYLQPHTKLEAPAELAAQYASSGNTITWTAVPGATYYVVDRSTGPNSWANLFPHVTGLSCLDNQSTGPTYAYRMTASNGQMSPDSPYSYVALFLSDANTDGSVTRIDLTQTKTPYNHATEPGIKAGELAGSPPLIHSRGILSFNTYLSGATVLTAELRLKQATSDDNFALLQPCKVDIQPGAFSGNTSLVGADYDSQNATTKLNAFQITGVGPNAWFDRDLSSLSSSVNTLGYIQFRIYFTEAFTAGKYIAWYSGDDPNNKPQLIVRYQP